MLGNLPQGLLAKHLPLWKTEAPPRSCRFVYDLYSHISANAPSLMTCPSSDSEAFSDSEEEELFAPLVPPLNFTIDPPPTDRTLFQPLHPACQCLVGKSSFDKRFSDRGIGTMAQRMSACMSMHMSHGQEITGSSPMSACRSALRSANFARTDGNDSRATLRSSSAATFFFCKFVTPSAVSRPSYL